MFKHLNDVGMDYGEHFTLSIGFSFKFLKGSFCALIHALFPSMYASTTTKIVHSDAWFFCLCHLINRKPIDYHNTIFFSYIKLGKELSL